ncbi:MAG: TonB-dependent receptor, partial [Bernardetiaceae bacterium]|nr:TonB-dependent receptor [Bernardetiaceae bacterium]
KDGYLNASYTYNSSRDNSSYNCCVANTSTFLPVVDDPRALNWGFSEAHFRHKLVINGGTPTWKGFNAGFAIRGLGGTPFSIHTFNAGFGVNGDFNDRNDLAFLYDPNNRETDPTLAAAIRTWLDNPDVAQYAKDYYLKYAGQVAPRNAGANPFAATIDLRITKQFKLYKKQGLELTADLFNAANLFDRYVGRNRNLGAEQRLFTIAGFDPASNNYRYRVNATTAANPVGGTPWRLQLGVRYVF